MVSEATMDKAMGIIAKQSALIDHLRAQVKYRDEIIDKYQKGVCKMSQLDHNFY